MSCDLLPAVGLWLAACLQRKCGAALQLCHDCCATRRLQCAACVTNAAAAPATISCDLGASTVWNAGETVEITVPATAGLAPATNAINTAVITDNQNRTTNDTYPVNINADPLVG